MWFLVCEDYGLEDELGFCLGGINRIGGLLAQAFSFFSISPLVALGYLGFMIPTCSVRLASVELWHGKRMKTRQGNPRRTITA